MKHLFLILLTIGFLLSCNQKVETESMPKAENVFDEKTELQNILATIEQETNCFYKRDTTCWAEAWVNDDSAFQAWNNDDGTIDASTSWQSVHNKFIAYMKNNPLIEGQTTTHPEVIRKNMYSKFYNDKTCFLYWDQYQFSERRKLFDYSKENRVMEKRNEKWKIVAINAFWDYKKKYKSKDEF